MDGLILGIDLGTTSVKIALLDAQTRTTVGSWSRPTNAVSRSEVGSIENEQDPAKIFDTLELCLADVPEELMPRVVGVGVCGQMHGVVLWKSGGAGQEGGWIKDDVTGLGRIQIDRVTHSNLFTWQDARCTSTFISTIPAPTSHLRLASGFGCVTLFWLSRIGPADYLEAFDCAGTIQDMLVAILCGRDHVTMCIQNAASWGYFNTVDNTWNDDILATGGFPTRFLPTVVPAGRLVGHTTSSWCLLPARVPVFVAMGDLQCSVLPKLKTDSDAVLNISTSAQLAVKMSSDFTPRLSTDVGDAFHSASVEYFPYFDHTYLAVAASLNGGNVLESFVHTIQQWTRELGVDISFEQIWSKLLPLCDGSSSKESASKHCQESPLVVRPTIYGERHCPRQFGCVENLTPDNTSLRNVFRATSRGIIANLCEMMPTTFLGALGVRRILGSGSVLEKNVEMQRAVEDVFGLPLVVEGNEAVRSCDAAVGASLVVLMSTAANGDMKLCDGV